MDSKAEVPRTSPVSPGSTLGARATNPLDDATQSRSRTASQNIPATTEDAKKKGFMGKVGTLAKKVAGAPMRAIAGHHNDPVTGVLIVTLKFEKATNSSMQTLVIHVDKARSLRAVGAKDALQTNPYVKSFLHSMDRHHSKRKTRTIMKEINPVFAEDLKYVDMMRAEDLMNDKLLLEVMSDNGAIGRNEFLGQALIPLRAGIEYCSSRNGGRNIELRLLEHEDFTPWEAGDPRTNAGGSSAAIPPTLSLSSMPHSDSTRSLHNSSPTVSAKSNSLPNARKQAKDGPPPQLRKRSNSGGSDLPSQMRDDASSGGSSSGSDSPSIPVSARPHSAGILFRSQVLEGQRGQSVSTAFSTDGTVDGEAYNADASASTLSPMFRQSSLESEPSRFGSATSFNLPDSISLRQLAETRQATALVAGVSYLVHVTLERIHGMPLVKGSLEDKYFQFSATVKRLKNKSSKIDVGLLNDTGMLTLDGLEDISSKMEVPFSLGSDRHVPRVELRVAFCKGGMLGQKQVIGNASVSLTSLPVYANQDEAEAEVAKTLPVDIYFNKPKLRHLPMGVTQRKDGNPNVICHTRARLWMTVLAQEVEQVSDEDDLLDEDEIDEVDEEIEDLPDNMPAPLEWVLAEATLDVPLHRLHHVIFDQNSKFMTQFCNAKKYTEVKVGPWAEDGTREFKYMIPKSALVKANMATEHQKYTVKTGGAYVVGVRTDTPDVPFGSSFQTLVQFKLVPAQNKKQTIMTITAGVEFSSSTWMKSTITNGAKKGMLSTYALFLKCLQEYLAASRGGKRSARQGDAPVDGETPVAAAPIAQEEESTLSTIIDTLSDLPLLKILHAFVLMMLLWYAMDSSTRIQHLEASVHNLTEALWKATEGSLYSEAQNE